MLEVFINFLLGANHHFNKIFYWQFIGKDNLTDEDQSELS